MPDFNELLKKKTVKTETTQDNTDMKERMRKVVNASKKLSDGDENTISNQKQSDLKERLAKAMEASKQIEDMYADEFDKDAEKKKQAEKDERKKKLEEQQQKALEKLAALESADQEEVVEDTPKKDLSGLIKKEEVKETVEPQIVYKEVIREVPVEVIKEVIKEVPVEVVKYVKVLPGEEETLIEALEAGEDEKELEEVIEPKQEEIEESTPEQALETVGEKTNNEVKEEPKKEKKPNVVIDFFMKSMNGMAYGLFATLIIGTILSTIVEKIPGVKDVTLLADFLTTIATVLKNSMGLGIGIGIAYNLGFKDIKLISIGVAGVVASYMCADANHALLFFNYSEINNTKMFAFKTGDPLSIYVALALTALAIKLVFRKKTSVDIIIVPLFASLVAGAIVFASSPAIIYVTTLIGQYIEIATNYQPLLMGMVIAVIMGMALTAPISSAAIAAVVLAEAPLAGGAAVVGCCVQMLGFAVHAARDNKIGTVISIGIGTSMLEFKNIIKKPVIWLPTIIVSAILGPIATCLLKTQCVGVNAGMGTSGLVGILGTLDAMGMSTEMLLSITILEIVAPILLVFLVDLLFRKLKIIKKGDFEI